MLKPKDLRAIRAHLDESQEAFGARFGVDKSTIHRWETYGLPAGGAARLAVERFAVQVMPVSKLTPQRASARLSG